MITINKTYEKSQIINKSEFIGTLFPIKNSEEAIVKLNEMKKKYYDASHNCYAYIWGDSGEYARYSDDGEPSQTAGVVILDCLKKNNLTNCLCVVTRYFGGIKLGASGLVRAYSSTTSLVVKDITPLTLVSCVFFTITISYNLYNRITSIISEYEEKEKTFLDNIKLVLFVPETNKESLKKRLIENTKGQINIDISEPKSYFI